MCVDITQVCDSQSCATPHASNKFNLHCHGKLNLLITLQKCYGMCRIPVDSWYLNLRQIWTMIQAVYLEYCRTGHLTTSP